MTREGDCKKNRTVHKMLVPAEFSTGVYKQVTSDRKLQVLKKGYTSVIPHATYNKSYCHLENIQAGFFPTNVEQLEHFLDWASSIGERNVSVPTAEGIIEDML